MIDEYHLDKATELLFLKTDGYTYIQLEDDIESIDPSYEKEMESHEPDEPPIGDNFAPANWLTERSCYFGWLEISKASVDEVMLTEEGVKNISLVRSFSVHDYIASQ